MAARQGEASTSKAASDTEGEQMDLPEATCSAGDELTDDQLMEVFKQTSIFNVKSEILSHNLLQGMLMMPDHMCTCCTPWLAMGHGIIHV